VSMHELESSISALSVSRSNFNFNSNSRSIDRDDPVSLPINLNGGLQSREGSLNEPLPPSQPTPKPAGYGLPPVNISGAGSLSSRSAASGTRSSSYVHTLLDDDSAPSPLHSAVGSHNVRKQLNFDP
jgi:hypothetical protein